MSDISQLRDTIRRQRAELDPTQQCIAATAVAAHILELDLLTAPPLNIAIYSSHKGETN
jgi:hypothetical protein